MMSEMGIFMCEDLVNVKRKWLVKLEAKMKSNLAVNGTGALDLLLYRNNETNNDDNKIVVCLSYKCTFLKAFK